MRFGTGIQTIILFIGDLLILTVALWLTLIMRYFELPNEIVFWSHAVPFFAIFLLWSLVFFIYDLYGKETIFFEKRLISTLVNAQVVNIIIALLFFYLIPYFGITPKTNLFIFLVVSFALLISWRRYGVGLVIRPAAESILFACSGLEIDELKATFKQNSKLGVTVCEQLPSAAPQVVSMVVFNAHDSSNSQLFTNFYNMLFAGVRFANVEDLYEELYGRVPVSIISERWFLEHISNHPKPLYDFGKRVMDVSIGLLLALCSLPLYPIIWFLLKIQDGGPLFIRQERIGRNNAIIATYKFRSMTRNEVDLNHGASNNQVTRVGAFLRKTRIDEFPQLWAVVRGHMSLIGPRPELPSGVERYVDQIPYYNIRHMIKPGLSGWAQMYHERHPHHGLDVVETRNKLSYDLYYVKHRSFWLDIKIALKTIALLLSVKGS